MLCALLCLTPFKANAQSPVGIAVGGDNLTRLVWNNADGSIALWKIAADGSVATQNSYGPYPGWSAVAVGMGPDSFARVLCTHPSDGLMALWRVDPATAALASTSYGPYSGYSARVVAVGGDNAPRLLWNRTDNLLSLWKVAPDASYTFGNYGPFAGYMASLIAAGPNSIPRTLWNKSDGSISLWYSTSDLANYAHTEYGPFAGYAAVALAVDSGNTPRIVWNYPSGGTISLWKVATDGTYTYQNFTDPAGYSPVALAAGTSGDVRLLWSNGQGSAQVWTIQQSGAYTSKTYPAPSALALSPASITSGGTSTGTVTLSSPAPTNGAAVSLTSSTPAAATVPASVTVAAGQTSATFLVTGKSITSTTAVTITAAYNGVSQTASLTVTAPAPVLTSIVVSPSSAGLSLNGTQQFTAVGKDQSGTAVSPQPSFTWSVVSGGVGTISSTGLYNAGPTAGTATVKAVSGTVSGTATVTVTNAAPTVATAASASPSPATGTTTTLSVLGADDGGAANLTYTWTTTGTPPAAVSFSANGTNAAKSVMATFTKAGSYSFVVTIKDAGGLTATSAVTVAVSQTLTSIAVSPASASVATGGTQQFTASAKDQFGAALSSQPSFTWSVVSGGVGSISTAGLYSAGSSAGSATVKAVSASVSGTAAVTVTAVATLASPTSLVATAGDGDVSLYWTGVSGASGYNIYRSTTSGSGYIKLSVTPDQSYEDNAISNGVTYYYVVTAVSGTMESAYSNEDNAQTVITFNLSAVSTGAGKITLYWDDPSGLPNNTGYNIYRGNIAGGENYTNPINGPTPVTALSYANGGTHIFTDVGLTNGQQYFYTVVAVTGAGMSAPSNEDSDYVDPSAIPWDSRNPSQIISAVVNLSSEPIDTGFDVIRVMGPDGAIYDNGDSVQEPPDATPSLSSNIWDLKDGTSIPVPEEINSETLEVTPAGISVAGLEPHAAPKPKSVPDNTGPLRRVVAQPGFVKASLLITLPPTGSVTQAPYTGYPTSYTRVRVKKTPNANGSITKTKEVIPFGSTGDTPYIYMGSFGTVVTPQGSRVVKATVDAGLIAQYDKTDQSYHWYVFNNPSGARDPFVSSLFASTAVDNKYFTPGDQVRMTYYLQNATGVPQRNKTMVYIKVESQTTGQPAIIIPAMIDTHPADGTGVVMKRVTSIAQSLAKQNGDYQKGYRKSGSFVLNETVQNGSLYSTGGGSPVSWSAARTLSTFEGFSGNLFFPSGVVNASVVTPYSFETNLGIDLR